MIDDYHNMLWRETMKAETDKTVSGLVVSQINRTSVTVTNDAADRFTELCRIRYERDQPYRPKELYVEIDTDYGDWEEN